MRIQTLALCTLITTSLLGCGTSPAQSPSTTDTHATLPLRTLRLYETGVGYFERSGTLDGRAGTSLPVPSGHLDDALASLVVLNSGGSGAVSGLSFASSVTKATARSRAGLPADPSSPIEFRNLLESMKGEKVTLFVRDAGEATVGRVVEVGMELDEKRARGLDESKSPKGDEPPKRLVVTVLAAGGAITQVSAESILRIRPSDPAFAARLDAALDALGTRSSQNARALRLLGDARGQITFGYVAETPMWRASYRLIDGARTASDVDSTDAAVLQGWALLHNDTDENWHDVHLELVNGEPDSFVFPLAAPRYARRELVHPEEPFSTRPQLQDTTADALWGDNLDSLSDGGAYGHGEGFGSGGGRLSGGHASRSPTVRQGATLVNGATMSSSLLSIGNLADLAPAYGVEQGALFVYAVPGGLSLEAHASALMPFVQRTVSVERVAYFAKLGGGGRMAVRFVNTTGQTLPAGTIEVFGAGGFTGETALDRLKPGERRFLQIANDLDVAALGKHVDAHEESRRLRFEGDQLYEHFVRTTNETLELENRGGAKRTFYVALSVSPNARVTGADRVDFDERSEQPAVVFNVKAKEKVSRALEIIEGLSRAYSVDALTEKTVRQLLLNLTIPQGELSILARALPRVRALEAAHAQVLAAEQAGAAAEEDLNRYREDLKALGGGGGPASGAGAAAPVVKRVVDAEDRVESARKSKADAEKTLGDRRDGVREILKGLQPKTPD